MKLQEKLNKIKEKLLDYQHWAKNNKDVITSHAIVAAVGFIIGLML